MNPCIVIQGLICIIHFCHFLLLGALVEEVEQATISVQQILQELTAAKKKSSRARELRRRLIDVLEQKIYVLEKIVSDSARSTRRVVELGE